MKKNIAIVTGGDSKEYNISILSAKNVYNNLNKKKFNLFIVELKNNKWFLKSEIGNVVTENNNFFLEIGNKEIKINDVFMALHGPPAENGKIQDFFEKRNIKYSCCNSETSKLTFDKFRCNNYLSNLGYIISKSVLIDLNTDIYQKELVKDLKFPLFIKPNRAGSSNGISKIYKKDSIENALKYASEHDNEIIIEEMINGKELSCGVLMLNNKIKSLPITEIISDNDFFDYDAKYNNQSKEITPAKISDKLTDEIKTKTEKIYKDLSLRGICRIDYILDGKTPYIIEINTIPGLSEKSIIPQQIINEGFSLEEIFTSSLDN